MGVIVTFQLNLETETVDQAYPYQPFCTEVGGTVGDVVDLLQKNSEGVVLICRDGVLKGIFTERDALKVMANDADLAAPIEDTMVRDVVTLSASATVQSAITAMSEGGFRQLPIVDDDGKPTGVLKVAGILRFLVEHFPNLVYTLPPHPNSNTKEREGA